MTANLGINIREMVKNVMQKSGGDLDPEQYQRQEQALIDIFEKGTLPFEALGFSEKFIDAVYSFAYGLYQRNKLEEASQMFRWLKSMVPTEQKYTVCLMHCFIQQKNWLGAIGMLMELAILNPTDPYPYEKMCDCLIELEDYSEALVAISQAMTRAGDRPECAADKERWKLTYDFLLSQLGIGPEIVEKVQGEIKKQKMAGEANGDPYEHLRNWFNRGSARGNSGLPPT